MTKVGSLIPIEVTVGVEPVTDKTASATNHYIFSDKVRTRDGIMEKIGGYESIQFDYSDTIDGYSRSLYTDFINGKYYTVIGTNRKLYSLIGTRLSNISPLKTTSVAAANSLATQYGTLSNNPFSTTNGSNFVTVSDTQASRFRAGDTVYFSGATGFAGIPNGDFAGDFIVRSIGTNNYVIYVATPANATTTGGGASVVRSSGLINVTSAAHDNEDGDRVKISGATDTGGILAAEINTEMFIRNAATNNFDVMTTGQSTSSVTGGGGASVVYFEQIPIGAINETNVQGYGAGLYGLGLYGTALTSNSSRSYPRIWFSDRYGDTIITTPGNQGALYQWQGSVEVAPAPITNAPTEINYAFVSNNIIVTLGAGGIENRIYSCDQNNITVWTSSSTNQVFDDDIEGAGRLISHCPVKDASLIFSEFETYRMRYIGQPFVWEIKNVDKIVGIIAPMARVSVNGMAFWMGQDNFYMYRGGNVEIIPSNTEAQSSILDYVFDNINVGQKSKCFAWYNKKFNEVWFHYPSAASSEPDRVARVNLSDFSWTPDTFERTAAEYPNVKLVNPRLLNIETLYKHEIGNDADGQPMPFTLTTNRRFYGKDNVNVVGIVPDSLQSGNIEFNVKSYLYPQSTQAVYNQDYTVSPTQGIIPITTSGRFYEYTISGNELGQSWKMGRWYEEVQKGPTS